MRPRDVSVLLKACIQESYPVMLTGAPGIGKTALVTQAGAEAEVRLLPLYPVTLDPVDVKGMPAVIGDFADFLPFGFLRQILEAEKPMVVFFDDLGQAPVAVQAAIMQLVLARQVNGRKVPDCITFIAATNRRQDRAGVVGLIEPLKSRFVTVIEVEANLDDFSTYVARNGLVGQLQLAFLRFKTEMLNSFKPTADMTNSPSPRTNVHVAKIEAMDLPEDIKIEAIAGAAGEAYSLEWRAFKDIYNKCPDPKLALKAPDSVKIPDAKDPSIMYAFAGGLAAHVTVETMDNFVTLLERIPAEHNIMTMKLAKDKNEKICETKAFIQRWAPKNASWIV